MAKRGLSAIAGALLLVSQFSAAAFPGQRTETASLADVFEKLSAEIAQQKAHHEYSDAIPVPERLSQTGLYSDIASKTIDPANLYYEPQYPLWSDGAAKSRWIRIPEGAEIDNSDIDRWVFPAGTRFWKEFSFRRDVSGPYVPVETRYIEKQADGGWLFAAYVWTADGSDAILAGTNGIKGAFPIGGGIMHDIPSVAECIRCHSRGGDKILGFDTLNLSTDRDGSPVAGLSLKTLADGHRLSAPIQEEPKIAAAAPEARAAIGYLHSNCGHCHNPQGNASFTGMFLRYQIAGTRSAQDIPAVKTAVGVRTKFFQIPGAAATYRIDPGHPESSAIYYRMSQRDNSAQMPPIATHEVDSAGLQAILAWINQ